MNKNENRRQKITEKIKLHGIVNVNELSEELKVSKETIRLDLDYLEKKGILYRVHGGAHVCEKNKDIPYDVRKNEKVDLKKRLAYKALEKIKNESVIFMFSSSINYHLAKLLVLKKGLTIYTNNIDLLLSMQDSSHKMHLIGGEFLPERKHLSGTVAVEMIKDIHFDYCIFGMDGCLDLDGPAITSGEDYVFTKTVLKNSSKKILISEADKFMVSAHYQCGTFADFDWIITEDLSPLMEKKLPIDKIVKV